MTEIAVGSKVTWKPLNARLYRTGKVVSIREGVAQVQHRVTLRTGGSIMRTTPVAVGALQGV